MCNWGNHRFKKKEGKTEYDSQYEETEYTINKIPWGSSNMTPQQSYYCNTQLVALNRSNISSGSKVADLVIWRNSFYKSLLRRIAKKKSNYGCLHYYIRL